MTPALPSATSVACALGAYVLSIRALARVRDALGVAPRSVSVRAFAFGHNLALAAFSLVVAYHAVPLAYARAARGGLVDEVLLDRALREGRLGGAGLDVLATEPPAPDHPLLSNERVLLSPHAAGLTAECAARMAVASVQNVLDHFAGRLDPALVVNAAEIGYRR